MIIGIVCKRADGGSAGAGKDAVADILVRDHGFVKVALADAVKRVVQQLYGFTDEQLWGSSEDHTAPNVRHPRAHGPWVRQRRTVGRYCACCGLEAEIDATVAYEPFAPSGSPQCYLTPAFVVQRLMVEGRTIREETWVDLALYAAKAIDMGHWYSPTHGDYIIGRSRPGDWPASGHLGVVIPDLSSTDEGFRVAAAGGFVWQVEGARIMCGVDVFAGDDVVARALAVAQVRAGS